MRWRQHRHSSGTGGSRCLEGGAASTRGRAAAQKGARSSVLRNMRTAQRPGRSQRCGTAGWTSARSGEPKSGVSIVTLSAFSPREQLRTSGAIQRYVPVSAVMIFTGSMTRATPKSATLQSPCSFISRFADCGTGDRAICASSHQQIATGHFQRCHSRVAARGAQPTSEVMTQQGAKRAGCVTQGGSRIDGARDERTFRSRWMMLHLCR